MVTKRKRRSRLAQASVRRRSERLAARESRRHRLQVLGTVLAVAAAVAALVAWIALHDDADRGPATSPASADLSSAAIPTATMAEGAR